ncbi:MAG: hydantoinase/oxoprolinase family protein [Geminicoccaceae bacterium]
MTRFRIGVDIGGTFTDIVLMGSDGAVYTRKVPSSVDDYAAAIVDGLDAVLRDTGLSVDQVHEILHGTTVAANAILEHKGARTGLITTQGFRDVLEIRNLRMPKLYDLTWEKPAPLVERYLRTTVSERVDAHGRVIVPLDPDDAKQAVDRLLAENVEALAICLLNSFANPAHELILKEIAQRKAPHLPLSVSCEVLPEIKEYERTSTTVINAYVMPIVTRYLASLQQRCHGLGLRAPLLLMQSNGGLTTAEAAARFPMNIIESGPAGGVIGGQALAAALGLPDIITFDMGGTTAKASIVEDGLVTRAEEYSVGAGIMVGSRLLTGAGYLLRVPSVDLAEVGAGGGSLVWIDPGGALRIGPESAGASPGPVCYDTGGTQPTVTDANVILGYINPTGLVGGTLPLYAAKAREVFENRIAGPLGLPLEQAAYGAHQIAVSNMIRAIKAVSTERGRDPRRFALFAFGGNGPLFAPAMARALQMRRIIVPLSAGVFSSFGLLYANVEHHYTRTLRRLLRAVDPAELARAWKALGDEARAQLAADGFSDEQMELRRAARLHYQRQAYELTVPLPEGPITAASIALLEEAFAQEHERMYGHRAGKDEPVELVTVLLSGAGRSDARRVPNAFRLPEAPGPMPPRGAYFGPEAGWLETAVVSRADLATPRSGPCIVEEYDATCLVPPGARAALDEYHNILIDL